MNAVRFAINSHNQPTPNTIPPLTIRLILTIHASPALLCVLCVLCGSIASLFPFHSPL
jgi:hypothetical protein